ncbi:hypothetical protein F5Y11DRAFT_343389 [Daldinia sp. FL1419]|nr:hypothetical protein F5Y11DRAFT_343389 [Daldinia sp. FL1419]
MNGPWPQNGLRPSRVSGVSASIYGANNIGILEEKSSIAVMTSHMTDMAPYTIFYLSDSKYRRLFMENEQPLAIPNQGRFTGIAVYPRVILFIFLIWEHKWVETLNEINKLVGIDKLFYPKRDGATMMFDSTFDRCLFYFTVLQTLGIFSEWIQESGRELQQLKQDFDTSIQPSSARRGSVDSNSSCGSSDSLEKIDQEWEKVIAYHSASSKSLLDRIEKKEGEIKCFRDGVSAESKTKICASMGSSNLPPDVDVSRNHSRGNNDDTMPVRGIGLT